MAAVTTTQPWDDTRMTAELVTTVLSLPRTRLDRLDAPTGPGVYIQFFDLAGTDIGALLGPVGDGRYPAYVGVAAQSLRRRLGRYRQTLRGVEDLDESRVHVAVLPCTSRASALFAEAALIDTLTPPMQGTGYGAKPPGRGRPGTVRHHLTSGCSTWDALFPGREWAAAPSILDVALAALHVTAYLAVLDPDGPRWERLHKPA